MAVAPPQQSSEAEAVQDQRGLLDKIEDFCSMPGFTDSISDFAAQHSQEFAIFTLSCKELLQKKKLVSADLVLFAFG